MAKQKTAESSEKKAEKSKNESDLESKVSDLEREKVKTHLDLPSPRESRTQEKTRRIARSHSPERIESGARFNAKRLTTKAYGS